MKKQIILMLCIIFLGSISSFAAKTYLLQLGTPGSATWRAAGTGDTIVNLATAGSGGAAIALNEWLNDKILTTPVFSGHSFNADDQIWLAKGTYTITGRDSISAGVSMYGGFAGTEFAISQRAKASALPWDYSNVTAIDGAGLYMGILTTNSTSLTSVIDGITFQNCTNSYRSASGGGAKIQGAKTTMQNCIVTGCKATGAVGTGSSAGVTIAAKGMLKDTYIHHNTTTSTGTAGGGVVLNGDTSLISGCKIEYNSAISGAGVYLYSKTSGAKVLNCTFSNNTTTTGNGAGIMSYITVTNISPITISDCTFSSNTSGASAGGAFLNSSIATNGFNIRNCTFTSNVANGAATSTAVGAGALYIGTGAFVVDKCTFTGNTNTYAYGGALLIGTPSSVLISNSKLLNNTGPYGSAIYSKAGITLNNCLIAGNTGTNVIQYYGATVASSFNNCTFANNLSSAAVPAYISLLNLTPKNSFTNCLFNKITGFSGQTSPLITNCGFETTIPAAGVNCVTDITDASFKNYAAGDFSLSQYSPAVDTGLNLTDSVGNKKITTDILGCPRPVGTGYDMGCYEYGGVPPTAVIAPQQDIIGFVVQKNTLVSKFTGKVQVFSITGKLFKSALISEGENITLPSGVYIVRLSTLNANIVQKVIL